MLFAFSDVGVPGECCPRAISFTGRDAAVTSQAPLGNGERRLPAVRRSAIQGERALRARY
jgi:hypothetical protein